MRLELSVGEIIMKFYNSEGSNHCMEISYVNLHPRIAFSVILVFLIIILY